MEMKLKIENEEDIKRNEEEKRKPHELLRMQQCMLWDQMENPDLNVHNLTRLYRYDKSNLNIEKFMNSLNKVIRHHPTYLTVLEKIDENNCVQRYRPELFKDIKLEKMNELEFKEKVYPNILYDFQHNLYDKLLINIRVIETEKYLYQIMDHHHIFFDGYSIKLFLDNLERSYNDKPLITDMYYLRLKELEEMKKGEKYNDMINYMNNTYNLKEPCGCPKKDDIDKNVKGLNYYKFQIPNLNNQLENVFHGDHKLYNNLIVLASMLAIAKHTNKKDIMVTWSYHGRDSLKARYIAGNLVRLYPIRIKFEEKMKIKDLNKEIVKQSIEMLKNPYYYPHILYSEDGEIMNNIYQKDLNKVEDFCGIKRVGLPVPEKKLENGIFTNQIIDACYNLIGNDLEVEWQYPNNRYKKETIDLFRNMFIKYCNKLSEHWNDDKEISIMSLID